MKYTYTPLSVSSKKNAIEVEDSMIMDVTFTGGCNGNTSGIAKLVKGQKVDDVIERLAGTTCGMRPTSCPDQLAKALAATKEK